MDTKLRIYKYPEYKQLSPQGHSNFLAEVSSFISGKWPSDTFFTPEFIPGHQNVEEQRKQLCEKKKNVKPFTVKDPSFRDLSDYQKAVTRIFHPSTHCRRLLISSSMGSGKTIMMGEIAANFSNYSLYPDYNNDSDDFYNQYSKLPYSSRESLRTYLSKHPGVPRKIVVVLMKALHKNDFYKELSVCPSVHSEYHRSRIDKVVARMRRHTSTYTQSTTEDNERIRFARAWCAENNVHVTWLTRVNSMSSNPKRLSDLKELFTGALVIIDEIHSIFTPVDISLMTQYTNNIELLTTLPKRVPLYGLVCLTGTPIISSYTNLVDLHLMLTSGDPFLECEAINSKTFQDQYVTQKDLKIQKLPLEAKTFLDRCQYKAPVYKQYTKINKFRPSATKYFETMFEKMKHYVYVYDGTHNRALMASKRLHIVVSNKVLTSTLKNIEKSSTPEEVSITKQAIDWSLKSLLVPSALSKYQQQLHLWDDVKVPIQFPTSDVRSNLTKTSVSSNIQQTLESYLKKQFTHSVLVDNKRFLQTLEKESPILCKLFMTLCRRKGKSAIYAQTMSKNGGERFCEIVKLYIKANPHSNLILPIPKTVQGEQIKKYIDNHILCDLDNYFTQTSSGEIKHSKEHSRIKAIFENSKEEALSSPIYFMTHKMSTGFSINGGVRELHIITVASEQVEGRGHRFLSHCGTDWQYDVYRYVNTGLFPAYTTSTCDILMYRLQRLSNMKSMMDYAKELLNRSSMICLRLDSLFETKSNCHAFPVVPSTLVE